MQSSQESTSTRVSFLMKFCEFCQIFKSTFFLEQLWWLLLCWFVLHISEAVFHGYMGTQWMHTGYSTTKQGRVILYPNYISFYEVLKLECIAQTIFKNFFAQTLFCTHCKCKHQKRRSVISYSWRAWIWLFRVILSDLSWAY